MLFPQTHVIQSVCLYVFRYQETSMCQRTAPQPSHKTLTCPIPSISWPLGKNYRWAAKKKKKLIVRANVNMNMIFYCQQVQKVQGAFNALGGADRLSSNRTYPLCTSGDVYVNLCADMIHDTGNS